MRASSQSFQRWAIVAFALFLLTPLAHLHTKAAVTDDASWSTRLASASSCSICSYHSNAVVVSAGAEYEPLTIELIAIPDLVLEWHSVEASPLSSRAPPALLT